MKYIEMGSYTRFIVRNKLRCEFLPSGQRMCFLVDNLTCNFFHNEIVGNYEYIYYNNGKFNTTPYTIYLLFSLNDRRFFHLILESDAVYNNILNYLKESRRKGVCFLIKNHYPNIYIHASSLSIPNSVNIQGVGIPNSVNIQGVGISFRDFPSVLNPSQAFFNTITEYGKPDIEVKSNFVGPSVCGCGFMNEYINEPNYVCTQCKLFQHIAS